MIFVNKNADYSANNIGKIDLPVDFSDRTKKILTMYNIPIVQTPINSAIEYFVYALEEANLFTKIKALCLPFLANVSMNGDTSFAQKNVITGDNFFTANIQGGLALTSNGLSAVLNGPVAEIDPRYTGVNENNIHVGAYNITPEPIEVVSGANASKYIFGRDNFSDGLCKQVLYQGSFTPAFYSTKGSSVTGSVNYVSDSCLLLANKTSANDATLFTDGVKTRTSTYAPFGSGLYPFSFLCFLKAGMPNGYVDGTSVNNVYSKASWSLLTVGEALTDSESLAYTTAVSHLMDVVKTI